jgi:23S rRNA (guanosine2251-2'-O)-methyltransferase
MTIDSVIIHDIRSTHNVGSILRTCDGLGIQKVYIGGISPYPRTPDDTRLPHLSEKLTRDIHKTALGAEKTVQIITYNDVFEIIADLKGRGIAIVGLEQAPGSIPLNKITLDRPVSLLLGAEVTGIEATLLASCDKIAEIPMQGLKESFNVSVAAGIALYVLSAELTSKFDIY